MTVHLALRTTSPPGLFQGLFAALTRWRLHTKFPHSGIVCDGQLYHATFARGLHDVPFEPEGWQLYPLPGVSKDDLMMHYRKYEGAWYDWFSLLGFVLPWRVTVSAWVYCFEWSFIVMTGRDAKGRVTPEVLLDLAHKMLIDEGTKPP